MNNAYIYTEIYYLSLSISRQKEICEDLIIIIGTLYILF